MATIRWEVLDGLVQEAKNGVHDLAGKAGLYAAAVAFVDVATKILREDGTPAHDPGFGYLRGFLSNFAIGLGFGPLDPPEDSPKRLVGIAAEDLYKARTQFER